MTVTPRVNAVVAAIKILQAEDGGYDLTRQTDDLLGRLQQGATDLPTLMASSVQMGGLQALENGMELPAVTDAGEELIDITERAAANPRTRDAGERARRQLAALAEALNPQTLAEHVILPSVTNGNGMASR